MRLDTTAADDDDKEGTEEQQRAPNLPATPASAAAAGGASSAAAAAAGGGGGIWAVSVKTPAGVSRSVAVTVDSAGQPLVIRTQWRDLGFFGSSATAEDASFRKWQLAEKRKKVSARHDMMSDN